MASRTILLGPQRRPTVSAVIRGLGVEGPIATVNAGWREREPDDAELGALLDGRARNLGLHGRWLDVLERDPEFAAAERRRRELLDELQEVYVLRLEHAVAAVLELRRRPGYARLHAVAHDDAVAAVRTLDTRHAELVAEVHAQFYEAYPPHERPAVAEHRAAVADLLSGTGALAIAGGHVGVLVACLHLFNVAAALDGMPVVAWSAGAMAVADRVVLFHDFAPEGRAYAEVYDAGLGLCRDLVPLPHARRRLRLGDADRVALFARRFAPARCVLLDEGTRVDVGEDGTLPAGTRVLTADGHVGSANAA